MSGILITYHHGETTSVCRGRRFLGTVFCPPDGRGAWIAAPYSLSAAEYGFASEADAIEFLAGEPQP